MSTDPSGILFYGFPLPSLIVDYHDLNDQWEEDHAPPTPKDKSNYRTPEWDEWRERNRQWEATLENVRIDWSGGENCEKYYLHCDGLKKSVDWDEQIVVTQADLAHQEEAAKFLHAFCDRFNLPKQQPQWHLATRYF